MIDYLLQIDDKLIVFLNSFHCPWADHFMMDITSRPIWIPLYVALALGIILRFGLLRGLIIVALIGLAVGCADMLIAKLIRPYFERLRPSHFENEVSQYLHFVIDEENPDGYRRQGYGFPSCHAANSVALAMAVIMVVRKWWFAAFMCLWAALHSYSRIYLGVHYPGDILVGSIIGGLIGLGFGFIAMWLAKSNKAPKRSERMENLASSLPVAVGILTFVYAALNPYL